MAKKDTSVAEEFPVTLQEFLHDIPTSQVESKSAFARLMRDEGVTGHKMRDEWNNLYTIFQHMPTSSNWREWITISQGRK